MINCDLAQSIVDKMMGVIPYNVNIMDENGVIVGSGDKSRINSVNRGALEALEFNKTAEIYKEDENTKKGVNLPICFKGRVVGVIGITGEPSKVREFGELVKVTAELLLNQEYSIQKFIVKNRLKEEYIYEWVHRKEPYNLEFLDRGKEIGIDIEFKGYVLVIEYKKQNSEKLRKRIKAFILENEYLVNVDSNKILLILKDNGNDKEKHIKKFIEKNCEVIERAALKEKGRILSVGFLDSLKAINIANRVNFGEKIISEKNIGFLGFLESAVHSKGNREIVKSIESSGGELLETFLAFINSNYEITSTAKELHIHRNTLAYRINKIEEITGLSFNDYIGKFILTSAYINYKIKLKEGND